jgi:hypothetical protein
MCGVGDRRYDVPLLDLLGTAARTRGRAHGDTDETIDRRPAGDEFSDDALPVPLQMQEPGCVAPWSERSTDRIIQPTPQDSDFT